jgi:hypothetical protein
MSENRNATYPSLKPEIVDQCLTKPLIIYRRCLESKYDNSTKNVDPESV